MSKVKRILSVIMAMVMVLAMSVPTFAAAQSANITVNNLDENATITRLQIIVPDQTTETGWAFANGALAEFQKVDNFSGLSDQQILWKLIKYADKNNTAKGIPTGTVAATAADFQDAMEKVEANLGDKYTATDVTGNVIEAKVAGVYAIKAKTTDTANYAYSPMAAFVSFGTYTTEPTALTPATVNAKKTTIKIEKSSSETDGVVEIDKEVTYKVTTNIPYIADDVANVTYTIKDTITGAEYSVDENNNLTVTVKIGTETPYTVTVNPQSNSFVLDLSTIAANRANANLPIEISYNAIVKSEIVENSVVPNDGTHTFTPATNTLYTGKITMTKQGETADVKLENAGFVIYRVDGDNTYYAMVEKDREKTNEYVVKSWTTELNTAKVDDNLIMTDANGEAVVRGLDDSYTYKFKEIKAPEGYSVNTTDSTAEWTDPHNVVTASSRAGAASMTDTKLNALPSTGGIGTTIFTIGGCAIMIVAAGLFFATRRKTQK